MFWLDKEDNMYNCSSIVPASRIRTTSASSIGSPSVGEGWEESYWENHPILVQIRSQSEFEKILIDRIYIPLRKRQAWVYKKG
jgi:hypothetical protein